MTNGKVDHSGLGKSPIRDLVELRKEKRHLDPPLFIFNRSSGACLIITKLPCNWTQAIDQFLTLGEQILLAPPDRAPIRELPPFLTAGEMIIL